MTLLNLVATDLGQPALSGTFLRFADCCIITAAGADIWQQADEGHFASIPHWGDFDFHARLLKFDSTQLYAKAGLMARESLAPGARHVFFLAFHSNAVRNHNTGGFEGQYRTVPDGPSAAIYPPPQPDATPPKFPIVFPQWLRLTRSGDTFGMWLSADGHAWTCYAQHTHLLTRPLYVGLAVSSHDPSRIATATFSDLHLAGAPAGRTSGPTPMATHLPSSTTTTKSRPVAKRWSDLACVRTDPPSIFTLAPLFST